MVCCQQSSAAVSVHACDPGVDPRGVRRRYYIRRIQARASTLAALITTISAFLYYGKYHFIVVRNVSQSLTENRLTILLSY